jgi:hypothetical protein
VANLQSDAPWRTRLSPSPSTRSPGRMFASVRVPLGLTYWPKTCSHVTGAYPLPKYLSLSGSQATQKQSLLLDNASGPRMVQLLKESINRQLTMPCPLGAHLQAAERHMIRVQNRELPPRTTLKGERNMWPRLANPCRMTRMLPELLVVVVHRANLLADGLERDMVGENVSRDVRSDVADRLVRKLAEL